MAYGGAVTDMSREKSRNDLERELLAVSQGMCLTVPNPSLKGDFHPMPMSLRCSALLFSMLLSPSLLMAQSAPAPSAGQTAAVSTRIEPGSTVFIESMNGFGTYLLAAFQKKKVDLIPVASKEQARYVITGTSEEKKAGWAKLVFMGQVHSDDAASVQMVDAKSGAIVFAYAVNKKNTWHGDQTTAEACAKHLQAQIRKEEKR